MRPLPLLVLTVCLSALPGAFADGTRATFEGQRVLVAELPYGAYWRDAGQVLDGETMVGRGVFLTPSEKGVLVTGWVGKPVSARRRNGAYKPSKVPKAKEVVPEFVIPNRALADGVDLELPDGEGTGMAVIRLERTFRGTLVWGPLSGTRYRLGSTELTWLDADVDGKPSFEDGMIYGSRELWCPPHRFTVLGDQLYREMAIDGAGRLSALVEPAPRPPAGRSATVLEAWNAIRLDHGLPPAAYEPLLSQHADAHASYLRQNNAQGHEQTPGRPGYSPEGHKAGMTSCIAFGQREGLEAMMSFLSSAYHRTQLIDPTDCYVQIGGNDYAFLMGYGRHTTRPQEPRATPQPQLFPAPGTHYAEGLYAKSERPTHPILAHHQHPGLPVIVRTWNESTPTQVEAHLYEVAGSFRQGKRAAEVPTFLSHAGKDAPEGFASNFNQVMLTPHAALSGTYEADIAFQDRGKRSHFVWRFAIRKAGSPR